MTLLLIQVLALACGRGDANGGLGAPSNPVPSISALVPGNTSAGGQGFALEVIGANFVSGSRVRWNGSDRTTNFIDNTRLAASISAQDIATVGTATITVFNPMPGGGTSNARSFVISPGNSVPSITSLSPASITAGGPTFTLFVNGANFINGSVVRWNGGNRESSFVSITQLKVTIPATDIRETGTAIVNVFNPSPVGGVSNDQIFTIAASSDNPVPTILSIDPGSIALGGAAFTLTVNGTNFISSSVVRWNGGNRETSFVSNTQLKAAISANDISTDGTAQVTIFNPAPGSGLSNSVPFLILGLAASQGQWDGPFDWPAVRST